MADEKNQQLLGEKLFTIDAMINATPSCLKIVSKDGHLLNMNSRGLALIEAEDMDSVQGANVYDLVEESHRENFINFNKKICNGESGTLIFEIIGLKGAKRWMETYAAPYKLTNGEIAHIAITNDITDRIENGKKLLEQKAALEETSRLATLGQFVSGIAHEINNPLTIIAGSASNIKRKIKNGELDSDYFLKQAEMIEKTAFRIAKIISGLKTLSRDSNLVEKRLHSLKSIVEDTVSLCAEKYRLNEITVEIDIQDDFFVFCNDIQISQVIMNLLNNSYDAILNLEEKWINIQVIQESESISLILTDSGKGIPDSVIKNMFNPFYTTKDIGHGTGLGLSICVGILIDHEGTFTFNKNSPHTQFIMKFPLPR
ncbi:MAG: hypothetical protein CO099_04960 [Bdellovibrio sp. CG_4_9_14_3_um_filter_39_7]|nr:MAG: hypothetical protein CO099_04960 [Bdellovibrio sp. CG_4_9_14_3_um_filter_39_7]